MPGKAIDSSASGCLVLIFPIALLMAILFVAWPVLLALVIVGAGARVWQHYQWQKWSQQVNPFFHKLIQENQGSVTAMDLAMKANLSGAAAKQYLESKVEEFGAIAREYPDRGTVYYFVTSATLGSIFDNSEPPSIYDLEPATAEPSDELEEDDDATQGRQQDTNARTKVNESTDAIAEDEQEDDQEDTDATAEDFPEEEDEVETSTEKPKQSQGLIQSELARRLEVHSSTVHKRKLDPDFPEWSRSRDPQGITWEYSRRSRLFFPIVTEPQDT